MSICMGDHGSRLTDFSQKKVAFYDNNLVIVQPISMKLEMCVDINLNLSPLEGRYAWVAMGHAWLIFVEKMAFSDDNFVIFRPILMKLEMWEDINPNLSPLKYRYAWVTIHGSRLTDFCRKNGFLWR